MRTLTPALFAVSLASSLLAQSNAVPGTDIRIYDLSGIAVQGRRGPAHPNGEAGISVGHAFCNAGSVNLPWRATDGSGRMLDTYPKIAFLLARDTGQRIEQISGQSFLKHSTSPFNFTTGPCAPCQNTGGAFFFVGCADVYGPGFNGSQTSLGPTTEINPWLGTFDSVGSYFDRGDPSVGGAQATDGIKSLDFNMTSQFDQVKNRMEVSETDLDAGGPFYAQCYAVIQGEPVSRRANNMRSQSASITWGGSSWNAALNGISQQGSVLEHWNGASLAETGNGNDDGRFLVAVKVTGPFGGMYHYEYAVHNIDNARGGASLRIPLAAGATVTNPGFHDIDGSSANDWAFSNNGNEIVFMAPPSNPHEWNTIYNFWFDCDESPSFGQVDIDQALPGPGAMTISVDSQVPSGIPTANVTSLGQGCGDCDGSFYELFSPPSNFDLAMTAMRLSYDAAGSRYDVASIPEAYVFPTGTDLTLAEDDETTVNLPFSLPYPGGTTTALRVSSNGFISPAGSNPTNDFPSNSAFFNGNARWAACWHDYNPPAAGRINFMSSPTEVRVTYRNLNPAFNGTGRDNFQYVFKPDGTVEYHYRVMSADGFVSKLVGWTPGNASDPGAIDLTTATSSGFSICQDDVRQLELDSNARPVLGTTIQLITSEIAAGTTHGVVLLSFGQHSPAIDLGSIGMNNCELHVVGNGPTLPFNSPGSSATTPFSVPNAAGLTGVTVIGQSFTVGPLINPLGVLASNALALKMGL